MRIIRAAEEMGIQSASIWAEEDANGLWIGAADTHHQVFDRNGKGGINAYLNIDSVIEAIKAAGADAVHPGYGFLSENAAFAQRCEQEGIVFVGPKSEHIELFGDKTAARRLAIEAGVPVRGHRPATSRWTHDIDFAEAEAPASVAPQPRPRQPC